AEPGEWYKGRGNGVGSGGTFGVAVVESNL
ncbi:unnamed protein product, partial [marine sediment metagenome]